MPTDWKPIEISDAEVAFPADVKDLLPIGDGVPDTIPFWTDFIETWFFSGLAPTTEFIVKDGIDGKAAFRHLRACMGSFQPKHEDKIAGCAYLASQWFEEVRNWRKTNDDPS